MVTVKNLTNSPYDLQSTKGMVRLPAFGEATADFTDDYLQLLEASMAVNVMEAPKRKARKPKKEIDPAVAKLRKDYKELTGKKPFGGWDAAELQKRIDEALAA